MPTAASSPRSIRSGQDFKLELPEAQQDLAPAVDRPAGLLPDRAPHPARDKDEGANRLKKEVTLSPEFQALWDRIKPKTTYRVEFETDELVDRAVDAIKQMEKIEAPKISRHRRASSTSPRAASRRAAMSVAEEQVGFGHRPVPDVLAYLQNETELTRSTLVRILKESGRLAEFFNNPQRFMDAVAPHPQIRAASPAGGRHQVRADRRRGPGGRMGDDALQERGADQLPDRAPGEQVGLRVRRLRLRGRARVCQAARRARGHQALRETAGWFEIDTPVGKYNPDWAILKHDEQALYLVRETKGTQGLPEAPHAEADKVRCGQKHFEALGVPFAVVVSADEV